jgi:hypothetical protein
MINQNEKYLLKFISFQNGAQMQDNELLSTVLKLGIKLNFKNTNPVYQIIDELSYASYCAK